jgi:hypothetical protein
MPNGAGVRSLKYDEYLAAGLPIATDVIEGACRNLVKDCLERTGMRWSASGAQSQMSESFQRLGRIPTAVPQLNSP